MVEAGVPLRVITSAALPVKAANSTPPGDDAVAALGHEPERLDGVRGDGGLAGSGIAEQPEHLLLAMRVLIPVDDRADGGGLLRRRREWSYRRPPSSAAA